MSTTQTTWAKSLTISIATVITIALLGCSGTAISENNDPVDKTFDTTQPEPRSLTRYTSDAEGLDALKTQSLSEMESRLDNYYTCESTTGIDWDATDDTSVTSASPTASGESSADSATSFTDTNLQESGVDEADIIKTDGTHLFVATNAGVDVFQIDPSAPLEKIASYDFENGASSLYLDASTLIVLQESGTLTTTIMDVSDATLPVTKNTLTLNASYVSSRLIDGVLHVVTNGSIALDLDYPEWDADKYDAFCNGDSQKYTREQVQTELDTAKEDLTTTIANATAADFLPQVTLDGDAYDASSDSFFADAFESGTTLVTLASLNLANKNLTVSHVEGNAWETYVTPQSVYFTAARSDTDATNIHRFALTSETGHDYFGSGAIPGHLLDSYSMDENDSILRVATTVGYVSHDASATVYSNVYALVADEQNLPIIGKVENIAAGEQIYAARFIGNRGYLVTFEKIDPLFVIDLADPTAPTIAGELEIPGYSTYLHPLGENHLIGLGKDAEDAGTFSWYQGLKLAVFDVTTASSPALVDDLVIGSRGTDSEALTEPHAFTFDAATKRLAIPLTLYEGGNGGSDRGDLAYEGVHVYAVEEDDGIATLAEVPLGTTVPLRSVFVSDGENDHLVVIDSEAVYRLDANADYDVTDEAALSDTIGGDWYTY